MKLESSLELKAAAYQATCESLCWWWPGTHVCYCSERPEALAVEQLNGITVFHSETGPACRWPDGWSMWYIHGTPVNEQIVLRPETQTIQDINNEGNADVKSIRIQRYTWQRYLRETNSQCIDEMKNDIEGTLEAVYASPTGENRLVATCPTGRVFCMGLPPEIKTCDAARRWLQPKPGRILART